MAEIFVALMVLPLLAVVYDLCSARQEGAADKRRFNPAIALRHRITPIVRVATRRGQNF